jgi:tRNA threonylcarbamoyladenosine biosynthesis protein TsaE
VDTQKMVIELNGEQEMVEFGGKFSSILGRREEPIIILLSGDLGAGKTTLCRGLLQGLGHSGTVKSPTYTLVESYDLALGRVLHVDLYRLLDPQELEHMGFADYVQESKLCLIEWPENGLGYLPNSHLMIKITLSEIGRCVTLAANNLYGEALINEVASFGP